jgi:hypothetical protein
MESPDGESVQANQLRFLRTALVERHRYWIWSFHEADGRACYLTVSLSPDRARCIGYEENYYGLTLGVGCGLTRCCSGHAWARRQIHGFWHTEASRCAPGHC